MKDTKLFSSIHRSSFIVHHLLMDAVGASLPDDDDFAAELIGDVADGWFVCDEGAVLFGAACDVDRCAR